MFLRQHLLHLFWLVIIFFIDVLYYSGFFRIVTVHIKCNDRVTRENLNSKLSLVDLAGSEGLLGEDASEEHVMEFLHIAKSLSA